MERLRGQLRDTAQYGQRDEFGGDTLEDTAMGGFRRGTRGVERLLKGRKQGQKKEEFPAQNNSGTPSDAPSTGEKRGTGSLRIKTREAVLEQATAERGSGIVRPRPGPEKVRTGAGSLGSERPVEPCARPAPNATLTPQERGRQAAKEQARQRAEKNSRQPQGTAHTAAKTAPQDSRSMPSECHSGEQHAAKQGGRRPTVASPEAPRCTGRGMNREGAAPPSVRKPVPSAKQIKTAQRSLASGQLPLGPAQVKAQAAAKISAIRSARAAGHTSKVAVTWKARTRAAARAVQSVVRAARGVVAAIAAGGSIVLSIVVVLCLVGVLLASPLGILFAGGGSGPGSVSPSEAVAQINGELAERLEQMQVDADCDRLEVIGAPPPWPEVLAVFAVRQSGSAESGSPAVLDAAQVEALRTVFWDMTKLTSEKKTVEHPASGSAVAWTEEVLSVTITPRTPDDMRVFYQFTAEQDQALEALLDNSELLASLAGDLTISSQAAKDLLAALPADLAPERRAVVQTACQLVGKVRYFWGGKSLKIGWDDRWGTLRQVTAAGSSTTGTYRPFGMDCSGFADWVFYNTSGGEYVIGHGGGAHAQHTYCTPISWEEALPGDLVFYPGDEHVGIVGGRDEAGDLLIVHCASNANNVVITGKSGFTSIGRPVYYRE